MGINEVEGVLTEFGSLIPGLAAKRFDIIAAGMYVTPERCQQVAFSDPTYGVGEAFLVKQGNTKNLHSYEDVVKNPDAKLGVVVGAIEGDYAQKVKIPAGQVVVFPDAVSALSGVQAGRADAYAATALTINDLMGKTQDGSGLEKADPFTDPVIDGKGVRAVDVVAPGQSGFVAPDGTPSVHTRDQFDLYNRFGNKRRRCVIDRVAALVAGQARIGPLLSQQLVMRAGFRQGAALQHQDQVGVTFQTQLFHCVSFLRTDRLHATVELLRNFGHRRPRTEQPDDLGLAPGQALASLCERLIDDHSLDLGRVVGLALVYGMDRIDDVAGGIRLAQYANVVVPQQGPDQCRGIDHAWQNRRVSRHT
ncbi:hypothetical protein G6F57_016243 [Rhizopus arrhizus]|nr:hypothetical protein G6F57_016243 [Rhizopus arrhizus]